MVLHLNKLEFPSPKEAFCQIWLKLAQRFSTRRFLYFVNVFLLLNNYLPLEKGGTLHLNKLESPSPRPKINCTMFGWNYRSSSGGAEFLISLNVFSLFRNYLPLKKGGALHLNRLEFLLSKNALCQVWLKLTQWFWRKRFFLFRNSLSSPLGKRCYPFNGRNTRGYQKVRRLPL